MYALHLFSRLRFVTASVTNWMGKQVLMYGCGRRGKICTSDIILYESTLHGLPLNRFAYWWRACAIYGFGQGQGQRLSLWLWKYVLLCFLFINVLQWKCRDGRLLQGMIRGFHGYNVCSPTNVPRSQDLSLPPHFAIILGGSRVTIPLDDRDGARNEKLNNYGKFCLPHRTVDCIGGHQRQGRNDLSGC